MKTTAKITQMPETQAVSAQPSRKNVATAKAEITEFGRVIQTLLGKKGSQQEISEEDLFAAAAFKVIKEFHGAEMAKDFKSAFKLARIDKPASEIYPSNERATREALDFFVRSTILTKDQASQVRDIAAQVCQLDNKSRIWDGWGKSKAVTTFADAQVTIQERLAQAISESSAAPAKAGTLSKPTYASTSAEASALTTGRRAPRGVKAVG